MNIKIVMLLTIGLLWSTVSSAQKVLAYGGNAEIDCREMKGVSKASKGFKNTSTLDKSYDNADEYTSEKANQQIYCRFEVAKGDTGTGEMSWIDALAKCRALNGGNWRLPTHRELTLIMVMSPELKMTNQFTPLDLNFGYWSATVAGNCYGDFFGWNDDSAWVVGSAVIGPSAKDRVNDGAKSPNKVRCIRELSATQ